jgi:hypothetical protein
MGRRTSMTSFVSLLAVAATWTSVGRAQDAAPPAAPVEPVASAPTQTRTETVSGRGGPSVGELSTGVITLGLTYGAAAIVAAESPQSADHRMFIPVAGPWMALFNRPGCGGATGPSCGTETAYSVLIVADGIGQALGSLMIIGAFLHPEERTVTNSTTATVPVKPVFHLLPASVGSGYGMQALGTF